MHQPIKFEKLTQLSLATCLIFPSFETRMLANLATVTSQERSQQDKNLIIAELHHVSKFECNNINSQ